ncbi:DUF4258 domain-containing protein [Flavobacterium myungsuense]|uniref:DUF4258 domain-containing protein n=1 Tax=Flavobacterium myungsuense TaxID=651823 RepID=A0ABW3J571_9FLAO
MLFEFSNHSLEQIKMRSISKEIVEMVINKPDKIIIEDENQQIFQKVVENHLYRVFINNNKNPSLIKTVYRTSKITKYL